MKNYSRRGVLRGMGVSASALPFLGGLGSLFGEEGRKGTKRVIVVFSPNGTVPEDFWPGEFGADKELRFGSILEPLEAFRERTLVLKGVHNRVGGDGDNHMRGMSCLLTGRELNPGNIQGGSHTPAGWASGISIDQEIKDFFQSKEETRTRFGSLEFGVAVPNRADPWTRMCYAGNNKPVAPIDDPAQMFEKVYGGVKDRESLVSVLDGVREDLKRVSAKLSPEDKALLEEHTELVREMEKELAEVGEDSELEHAEPEIDPEIELVNDNTPQISKMQIDLMVSALANDMARVATLQFMRSVGQAQMRWLGIEEGHHGISHEPDGNKDAVEKLRKINRWFAGELAYLCKRLAETPEPGGGGGTMLDYTQVVWLNELGKGNSHTLDDIPFVLVGGGGGFKTGRALDLKGAAHNRLWLSLANSMGHGITEFGKKEFCEGGALGI